MRPQTTGSVSAFATLRRASVLAAIVLLHAIAFAQSGNEMAVVVSPKNPVVNLSMADLRRTFTGEKRSWAGNIPVKIIVRPPGAPERPPILRLMGISESDYKQYWTAAVYRGDADSEPLVVPSVGMVKAAMGVYPGAIALVAAADAKLLTDVKIVKVDGHLPGEPGYPVH